MSFSLLHVHSEYSPLDGMILFPELVEACQKLGISSVGLTDHRTTSGWVAFDQALRPTGITPIFGVEPDVVPNMKRGIKEDESEILKAAGIDPNKEKKKAQTYLRKLDRGAHITLLAQNDAGVVSIQRAITASNRHGWKWAKPRLDLEVLRENKEGMVVLSGCSAGVIAVEILRLLPPVEEIDPESVSSAEEYGNRTLQAWRDLSEPLLKQMKGTPNLASLIPLAYQKSEEFRDTFGDNFFLEIMPNSMARQNLVNYALYRIGEDLGIPLVATTDCHYTEPSDALVQEVLLALQFRKRWSDVNRFRFATQEFGIMGEEEMKKTFFRNHPDLPEAVILAAIDNACFLGSDCKAKLPTYGQILPSPLLEPQYQTFYDNDAVLDLICSSELVRKKLDKPEYRERMRRELGIIREKGFANYLLVARGIVREAQRLGIRVGPGRGSSAGSLVCYLLGITQVDSIRHKLMFERFIDITRTDAPDIDLDFQEDRRGEIKRFLEETYGQERVASLATHVKMGGRAAFRKVCSVGEIPLNDVNFLAKIMIQRRPDEDDPVMEETFTTVPEAIQFKERYNHLPVPVVDIATRLEGRNCGKSTHAAGLVIGDRPLEELVAIERREIPKNKQESAGTEFEFYCAYDKDDLVSTGLLKFDILGLKFLTVIEKTCNLIGNPNLNKLPLDDPEVYSMLAAGHTAGVFQLETQVMRRMCMNLQVDRFEDLVAANALVRPGAARAGAPQAYANRKLGREKVQYPVDLKILQDILQDTYGVVLFQEQIVRILKEVGNLEWDVVNKLRKAMAKSQGAESFILYVQEFKEKASRTHGIHPQEAAEIFRAISFSGSYAFSRAHSVSYSLISYWTAWLKFHCPTEFLFSVMSCNPGKPERISEAVREARRMGISVLPPDVNYSEAGFTLYGDEIFGGLSSIKGLSEESSRVILALQDSHWLNHSDFEKLSQFAKRFFSGNFKSLGDFWNRLNQSGLRRFCNTGQVEKLLRAGTFDSIQAPGESTVDLARTLREKKEPQVKGGIIPATQNSGWSLQEKIRNLNILIPYPLTRNIVDTYAPFLHKYFDGLFPYDGQWIGEGFWKNGLVFGRVVDFDVNSYAGEEGSQYTMVKVDDGTPEWKTLKLKGTVQVEHQTWIHQFLKGEDTQADGAIVALVKEDLERDYLDVIELESLRNWQMDLGKTRFQRALMFHPFRENQQGKLIPLQKVQNLSQFSTAATGGWLYSFNTRKQRNGKEMAFLNLHDGQSFLELIVFGDHWSFVKPKVKTKNEILFYGGVEKTKTQSITLSGRKPDFMVKEIEKKDTEKVCSLGWETKKKRLARRQAIPFKL